MKKSEVKVGGVYRAKVSNKVVEVRIDGESQYGGWNATNLATGKAVRIKSAQRLRATSGREMVKAAQKKLQGGGAAEEAKAPAATTTKTTAVCPRCKGEKTFAGKTCPTCKGAGTIAAAARMLPSDRLGVPPTTPDVDLKVEAAEAAKASRTAPQTPTAAKPDAPATKGAKVQKKAPKGDGKLSGLDAAAKVLGEAKEPMNAKDLVAKMLYQGLWTTTGKTPAATIYAAILREIQAKGDQTRFRKVEKGKFALAG